MIELNFSSNAFKSFKFLGKPTSESVKDHKIDIIIITFPIYQNIRPDQDDSLDIIGSTSAMA